MLNQLIFQLAGFIVSFLMTYCMVPFFVKKAYAINFLDHPNTSVKKHTKPIPYLGGVAVFFGMIFGWLSAGFCITMVPFIILIFSMVILGLVDDYKPLSPFVKIIVQSVFACTLLWLIPMHTIIIKSIIFFWIILMINAYNLIDIMDGLLASVSVLTGIFFAGAFFYQGDVSSSVLFSCFIGSIIAFFCYNKPPARIYMGDAGALSVGALLSIGSVMLLAKNAFVETFFVVNTICFIPLFEVLCLIIIRTSKGLPFYYGSPHHFALYLQRKKYTTWFILLITTTMGFIVTSIGSLLYCQNISYVKYILAMILSISVWLKMIFF